MAPADNRLARMSTLNSQWPATGTRHAGRLRCKGGLAATAERYQLTVLHYDGGYERIAAITGQATEWIVPRGTADAARNG
jgi:predicted nucleic acid-binding protein